MRLFEIGDNFQVKLNKEWILMIPEFSALLKRDKGSKGDYRGDKKLKATRELTFIYFDLDFTSPIREWPDDERRAEALRMAGLEESDIDGAVMDAHTVYDQLLMKSARSLRTLRAVEKSLDQLDRYYETLDFTKTDRKGELLHDPSKYLMNLKRLGEGYDALDQFRKRVTMELKGDSGIRGNAQLGRKEGKRETWTEAPTDPGETAAQSMNFSDIAHLLRDEEEDDLFEEKEETEEGEES